MAEYTIRPIAYIRSDFHTKFGIPRQAGIVPELESLLVFEPEFRDPEALRGIEGFSHLWLIWQFSENVRSGFSPTVRPPRLGGNERMGVFATRSPFRPNALGLSCVELAGLLHDEKLGIMLRLRGADLMYGTPVYDIKPYVPYADCRPEALSGFAPGAGDTLEVCFEAGLEEKVPAEKLDALRGVLANDPRPRYQKDPERVYAMEFADMEVKFSVDRNLLTVREIIR